MDEESSIAESASTRTKKQALQRDALSREPGRTLLPVSRVQKIMKADRELPIVAKEAVFAISLATEEFIKRLTIASQRQAERESRATVQRRDLVTVVERADEFFFLEDIYTWIHEENKSTTNKKMKTIAKKLTEEGLSLIPAQAVKDSPNS